MCPQTALETSVRAALASAHCYMEHIPSHKMLYEPIHSQLTRAFQILTRMEKYALKSPEIPTSAQGLPTSLSQCVDEYKLILDQACRMLKRYSLKGNGIQYLANILKPKRSRVDQVDALLYKLKKLFQQCGRWNALHNDSQECIHCSFVNVPRSRFCGYCDKELQKIDVEDVGTASPSHSTIFTPREATRQLGWISHALSELQRPDSNRLPLLQQILNHIDSLHFEFITQNGVSIMTAIALTNSLEDSILALQILQQIVRERDYWIEDQLSVLHKLISVALELSVRGRQGDQRAQALALLCSLMEMCEIAMFVRDTILENLGVAALLESLREERDTHRRRQVYDILYLMASFRPNRTHVIDKNAKNMGVVDAALPGTSSLQLMQTLRVGTPGEKIKALELLEAHAAAIAYDLIVLYAGIDQLLDILRFDMEIIKEKAVNVLLRLGIRDDFYRDKLLAANVLSVVLDLVTDTTSGSLFWACIDFVINMLDAPGSRPYISSQ
uniref:AlNc14C150G7500 protein n=1 Tax=Albugo laibachii Nc14 TaxID=890382 RepID=F0WLY7_9STRA|nr:AlNc14C150G7500 [Albugo laibachii Nc14]|eukprot:CCA22314.1 AlNc14C150G7500 [Albugo laibachii Nc14]